MNVCFPLKWKWVKRKSEQVCGDSFSWTHRPMYDLHLQGLLTALVVCRALTITYNLQADWRRKQEGNREAPWVTELPWSSLPRRSTWPYLFYCFALNSVTFLSFPSGKRLGDEFQAVSTQLQLMVLFTKEKGETEFEGSQPAVSNTGLELLLFKGSLWVSSPPEN